MFVCRGILIQIKLVYNVRWLDVVSVRSKILVLNVKKIRSLFLSPSINHVYVKREII